MTTTMTTQAIVNDLAARTKPCPSCKGYRIDKGGSEGPCFMCKGTGTVPAFPWLWEECRGLWVDFQREKVHKSSPYYGCCDGSGQRMRRAETVHLEEGLEEVGGTTGFTRTDAGWLCTFYLGGGKTIDGVGESCGEAFFRALYAVIAGR